jgi:hypothetical protein
MLASKNSRQPQMCFSVGITGHRLARLGVENIAPITALVADVLHQLEKAVSVTHALNAKMFLSAPFKMRLVSALAQGADTLSAELALAAGWQLEACLPFAQDIYAADFSDEEDQLKYRELVSRAESVFALPGTRAHEKTAYEDVGRLMLEQSDIVLALWDGDAAFGRGGTAQIVAEAVARHIPVIHIDTRTLLPPFLLWSGLSDLDLHQPTPDVVPRALITDTLLAVVQTLVAPPDTEIDRRMLGRFFDGRKRTRTPAIPYPLLLALTGVRKLATGDIKIHQPDMCAARLNIYLDKAPETGPLQNALQTRLLMRFGVADASASYFAQIFRSGFVVNFGFAALAVLLASVGLLLPTFKLPLIGAELFLILLILANTRTGAHMGWHERWMDDRHLAEQLRTLAITSLMGDLDLRDDDLKNAATIPGWVRWLSRATARELGLPAAHVDDSYLSKVRSVALAMIDDQINYHAGNAQQVRSLDHRLHHIGGYLFGATIIACTAWIFFKLMKAPMIFYGIDLTSVVTVITAVLPAIGAALYGIRMQGDFAGIAERSLITVKRLERLKRVLESDGLAFSRLQARLRQLSDIMLSDVARWRTTYQTRPLTLPG